MLLLILGIGLLILVAGIIVYLKWGEKLYHQDNEWVYYLLNVVGSIVTAVSLIAILSIGIEYSNAMVIDDKIALYQEENEKIENEISVLVENYKKYETDTLKEFNTNNPSTILSLYPELKSDALVCKQIELYTNNCQQIKELKELKLDYGVYAWWLYFGD